jgi:hypothetical protein
MKAILRSGFLALVFLFATACSENVGEQGDVYTQHKGDADAQLPIGIKEDRQDLPASDGSTANPNPKAVKTIRIGSDGKPIPE